MFTSALKWAGPTFIKLGQWASTRPDLFPNDMCNELSLLHECAGSGSNMSFPATCSLLKQTIGMDVEDVFFSFEPEPCGSGCIATVYRASVVPLGEQIPVRVAVKVIRPGVRRKVMRDIRLMRRVVSILYTLCNLVPDGASVQWLSLREACEQFETFMLSQLDMRDEANNLLKFRENFAGDPCIRFPKPLFEVMTHDGGVCNLSHPDVLVETFQDGVSLSAFLRSPLAADIPLCRSLAQQGVRAFLQMTLRDNFVHADLHPGNIIVNDDTLSFIDAGLVTTLTPSDKENFLLLFTAVAKKDGRSAARHMLERSRGSQCTDPGGYAQEIESIVNEVAATSFQLQDVHIGSVLRRVLRASRKYKVKLDANFTSLVLSIIILEGVGRQLDETLDIFKVALLIL